MNNIIRVVPLSEEELKDIQIVLTEKILHIHHLSRNGNMDPQYADAEITRLSQVAQKCSKYGVDRYKKVD